MNNKINSAEDFEKWKANQKLDKQKHVAKIKQIEKLEDKIEYWLLHMESESFFTIDKSDQINLLDQVTSEERPEVIKAEIRRLDATNKDFISTRLRSKFYDRTKETNDLELTKTKFIDTINKHIDTKEFTGTHTKAKLKGFEAYFGGRSIEKKAEDLRSFSIGEENRLMFGHIYEGYLLAELVSEINQIKQNEISRMFANEEAQPQQSPLVAALVLKHLGIVEKIAAKEQLSNEKVMELLNALFGGPMQAGSISSSYRDRLKATDKGRKDSLMFLKQFGTSETFESFLSDWKSPKKQ